MLTLDELTNSNGLYIKGRVHEKTRKIQVADPDYVIVALYVVYARELLTFIRRTISAGGRLRLQCMNLERICKGGLGYDPELLAIIGTTQEEVEQLRVCEHVHGALTILDALRDVESRGERMEPYMWQLRFHCKEYFGCSPEFVQGLGLSAEEYESLKGHTNVKEAEHFLHLCRMQRDRDWSKRSVQRDDREWPAPYMDHYAGHYLWTYITKSGVTCEELGTTLEEVESFPRYEPRRYRNSK